MADELTTDAAFATFHCPWCSASLPSADLETCPSCKATNLQRLLSLPALKTETTKAQAMKAAMKRDKAQGTERTIEQTKYEQSHND